MKNKIFYRDEHHWKLHAKMLAISQLSYSDEDAEGFAEACYENICGDIDNESPQDCIDAEIDAMRNY